jgi:hypothetical protein
MERKSKKRKGVFPAPRETWKKKPTLSGDPGIASVHFTIRLPPEMKAFLVKIGPKKTRDIVEAAMLKRT